MEKIIVEEESWLSGPIEGIPSVLMPVAHALLQAVRDIEKAIPDLTNEKVWTRLNGAPSVGFQLLHIAGSIDRLLTYSEGKTLSPNQFDELALESQPDESVSLKELKEKATKRIEEAIRLISQTSHDTLFEKRFVGRKKLPTNVFGLLFHIAEHTQRHVGQAITTAKIIDKTL